MYSRRGPEYPTTTTTTTSGGGTTISPTSKKRKLEEETVIATKPKLPSSVVLRPNVLTLDEHGATPPVTSAPPPSGTEELTLTPKHEKGEAHESSEDEYPVLQTKGTSVEVTPTPTTTNKPSNPVSGTSANPRKNLSETVEDFLFFANTMLQESERSRESSPSPPSPAQTPPPVKSESTEHPFTHLHHPQPHPYFPTSLSSITSPPPSSIIPRRGTSKLLKEFLDSLIQHECAWPFLLPVDSKEAPDYYAVVKNPMDFTTIQKRIEEGLYENDVEGFANDVRLIFDNCLLYNSANSHYSGMALTLSKIFEGRFKAFCEQVLRITSPTSVSPAFSRVNLPRSTRITPSWTENEDSRLKKLIDKHGEDWNRIAKYFPQKTPEMCQERSESGEFQSQDIVPRLRRNWSKEEDELLKTLVAKFGGDNWELLAAQMPANSKRSAAGCKNRWTVLESKKLDRTWTIEEEAILTECWKKYGHQWSKYHKYLPTKPYFTIRKRALELWEPSLA